MQRLKGEKHRLGTKKNYLSVWRSFNEFFIQLDRKPRSWEDRLVLFVGYLIENKRKAGTVKSYISAIKSVLADDGVQLNLDRCLLNALTRACRLAHDKVRTRLPIQRGVLSILVKYAGLVYGDQPYLLSLYRSLFTTMYYGLFRVGELTTGSHPVKATDVHIAYNKRKLMFVLRSSKTHTEADRPQVIKISSDFTGEPELACPFTLLQQFLALRRSCRQKNEPFFIFRDRSPVTPAHLRRALRAVLTEAKLDPLLYDTHSFRAGRAVDLVSGGTSVESLKQAGRWRSNAVYRYLSE